MPVHDEHAQHYEQEQKVTGHVVGWDGLCEQTQEVCKLLTVSEDGEETNRRLAILNERFGKEIVAMQSNARYGEIVNPGVSKAEGIRRLADKLGIAIEDTMAIGDSYNDLPMLKAAGHSVAMGNAVPEVKAVCDYETGRCEDFGFAQAIRELVLGGGSDE